MKEKTCEYCGHIGDSEKCVFNPKNKDCACCEKFEFCCTAVKGFPYKKTDWANFVAEAMENHDEILGDRMITVAPFCQSRFQSFFFNQIDNLFCPHCDQEMPENYNYLASLFHAKFCHQRFLKKSCFNCRNSLAKPGGRVYPIYCGEEAEYSPVNSLRIETTYFYVADCPFFEKDEGRGEIYA